MLSTTSLKDSVTVHYGIRPSGEIHLGNVVTAVYGYMLLTDAQTPNRNYVLTVNDWDGDNPTKGTYDFGKPLMLQEGSERRQQSLDIFCQFMEELATQREIQFSVLPTSELLQRPKAKKILYKVCDQAREVFEILGFSHSGVPVFPLHSETKRYVQSTDYGAVIEGDRPFEMPIEVKLALKHAVLDDEVDYFVLGKNYSTMTIQKIRKISRLLGFEREYCQAPVVFVGSKVMSKSRGNVVKLDDLLRNISPEEVYVAVEKVIRTQQDLIQSDEILREIQSRS